MIEKDYLPQYAAEATRDLRKSHDHLTNTRLATYTPERAICGRAELSVAEMIEKAMHMVLPVNGEIYRDRNATPTKEEGMSFVGIPAPFVTIEYPCSYSDGEKTSQERAWEGDDGKHQSVFGIKTKCLSHPEAELILLIDFKQLYEDKVVTMETDETPTPVALMHLAKFSHPFTTIDVRWVMNSWGILLYSPFEVTLPTVEEETLYGWKYKTPHKLFNLYEYLNGVEQLTHLSDTEIKQSGIAFTDSIATALQACHALNVGAVLETRKEKSYTRNRTLQKQGVGGFEYHVLRLPHGTVKETLGSRCGGGERDGPRYHFRRAHLRNLSKGTQTFVRSCFVGNRDKGVVEKNYELDKEVAA